MGNTRSPLRPRLHSAAFHFLLLVITGCASVPRNAITLDVPFRAQEAHQCGAAALGMVLAYQGTTISASALSAALYIPALHGTIPELLADVARAQGFDATLREATPEDLVAALRSGIPPIVLIGPDRGHPTGHFVVVTGASPDGETWRVHGSTEANLWWPRRQTIRRWQAAGSLMLTLSPRREHARDGALPD